MAKYEKVHVPFSFVVGADIIMGEVESVSVNCWDDQVCVQLVDGTLIYTTVDSPIHTALKREYRDANFDRRVREIVRDELAKVFSLRL